MPASLPSWKWCSSTWPQGVELLVDVGAHAHQPQPVPLGVAGPGELLEVGEQAVLKVVGQMGGVTWDREGVRSAQLLAGGSMKRAGAACTWLADLRLRQKPITLL